MTVPSHAHLPSRNSEGP